MEVKFKSIRDEQTIGSRQVCKKDVRWMVIIIEHW